MIAYAYDTFHQRFNEGGSLFDSWYSGIHPIFSSLLMAFICGVLIQRRFSNG
ncbi:hypothetical protein AusDCA_3896 [Desulfitobacterium sp. AusDCA]